jgi:hypothetical protein
MKLFQIKKVCESAEIQGDTNLYNKVLLLIENMENPASLYPTADANNTIFDVEEPLYALQCASIERWDYEFFTKTLLRLVINWDQNELLTFLKTLSLHLAAHQSEIPTKFRLHFYVPKFGNVSVVRDWFQQLLPIFQVMFLPESVNGDAVKKICQGFCLGREDPRFTTLKENTWQEEDIENTNPTIRFAEDLYTKFMKNIYGEFGEEIFKPLMEHIKSECSRSSNLEANAATLADTKIPLDDPQLNPDKVIGVQAAAHARNLVESLFLNKNVLEGLFLTSLVQMGLEKYLGDEHNKSLLKTLEKKFGQSDYNCNDVMEIIEKVAHGAEQDLLFLASCLQQMASRNNEMLQEELAKRAKREENDSVLKQKQQELYKHLSALSLDINLKVPKYCRLFLDACTKYFHSLAPNCEIFARIAFHENFVKLGNGKRPVSASEDLDESATINEILRIVGCSDNISSIVGSYMEYGKGIDAQLLEVGAGISAPSLNYNETVSKMFEVDPAINCSNFREKMDQCSFVGVPLQGGNKGWFGTLCIFAAGKKLDANDLATMEHAGVTLGSEVDKLLKRQSLIDVTMSAKEFMHEMFSFPFTPFLNIEGFSIHEVVNYGPESSPEVLGANFPYGSPYLIYQNSTLSPPENNLDLYIRVNLESNSSKVFPRPHLPELCFEDLPFSRLKILQVAEL